MANFEITTYTLRNIKIKIIKIIKIKYIYLAHHPK